MSISKDSIENIIFDFGGVLFEIDYFAPVREFEKLGFGSFQEIYNQAKQNPVFDQLETGKISNETFLDFLNSFCPEISREQVLQAWNSILIGLMPAEADAVAPLRNKGYRTFIFSNTNAIHVDVFEKMIEASYGLEKFRTYFEKIIYSNVVGFKKPYPESFLMLCDQFGLNPGATLFIDDSAQHVDGAKKAGLQAYHLKPGENISVLLKDF